MLLNIFIKNTQVFFKLLNMNKKGCLIILSHSSYSDIWPLLLKSYSNYFDNTIPLKKFLISDKTISEDEIKLFKDSEFNHLHYPGNNEWGADLAYVIQHYIINKFNFILFSFDDLILTNKIDCTSLTVAIEQLQSPQTKYIKLVNTYKPLYNYSTRNISFFEINKKDSYRGSLVFSVWKTNVIKKIISNPKFETYSAWEYERNINKIIGNLDGFQCIRKSIIKYSNVIIKGKIDPVALKISEKANDYKYKGNRKRMPLIIFIRYKIKTVFFKFFRFILPQGIFTYLRKAKQLINNIG